MAGRGRPAKPTAFKVLTGETRRDRINAREPKYAVRAPACPSWLAEEARVEWKRVAKLLVSQRVLTEADRALLACYCHAWAQLKAAEETIQREGAYYETEHGIRAHPAVKLAEAARADIRRNAVELGLSPSSRSRISSGDTGELDDTDRRLLGM